MCDSFHCVYSIWLSWGYHHGDCNRVHHSKSKIRGRNDFQIWQTPEMDKRFQAFPIEAVNMLCDFEWQLPCGVEFTPCHRYIPLHGAAAECQALGRVLGIHHEWDTVRAHREFAGYWRRPVTLVQCDKHSSRNIGKLLRGQIGYKPYLGSWEGFLGTVGFLTLMDSGSSLWPVLSGLDSNQWPVKSITFLNTWHICIWIGNIGL